MATYTMDKEYVADNDADFPVDDDRYPVYAKDEIDLLVDIAGRLSDVDSFTYSITADGYLQGTFDSDPKLETLFNKLSSIAETTEVNLNENRSTYTIVVNNI